MGAGAECGRSLHKTHHLKLKVIYVAAAALLPYRAHCEAVHSTSSKDVCVLWGVNCAVGPRSSSISYSAGLSVPVGEGEWPGHKRVV